jgi:hypothetical protein
MSPQAYECHAKTRNLDMMKEKANLVWCAAELVVKNTVEEEK